MKEQKLLKENLKNALQDDDGNEDGWGDLFKVRQKNEEETTKEEQDYIEWLAGQRQHLSNEAEENELKPLKEFWSDPKLNDGDVFLRDYILNKK